MAIFDVRGTHGSGKSYLVHTLLGKYGNKEIIEDGKVIGHYAKDLELVFVGSYNKVCGGCDGISKADRIVELVRYFSDTYKNVLLEGSLVGHTYTRYANLAGELGNYHFIFLTTPLRNCIARVVARRRARGNTKPFNPKAVIHDHRQTQTNVRKKFEENGYSVRTVNWLDPINSFLEIYNDLRT